MYKILNVIIRVLTIKRAYNIHTTFVEFFFYDR